MAKTNRLRHSGAIPERQHDAFLLALLIAVSLNIAFFAIQSILPLLLHMLYLLAPIQPEKKEDVTNYAFEYVDPAFLDEELDPDQVIEAESSINRRARQSEAQPDLPEGLAAVAEGVDEYLTAPDGNPGENLAYVQTPGQDVANMAQDNEDVRAELEEPQPEDLPEIAEVVRQSDPNDFRQAISESPPLSQMFDMEPMEKQPLEPEYPPPDMTEMLEDPTRPPAEALEEPLPEEPMEPPPPEAEQDPEIERMEPAERLDEEPTPEPEPSAETIDLASLPMANDGFFDPETRRMEEIARRQDPLPPPVPQWSPQDVQPPIPQPQHVPASPTPSPESGERRRSGRQPTFKSIGGTSESGGAPPRRNTSTSVKVLDADASMALLAHRYGPYMRQVWEKLQASLIREMVMSPTSYTRGQVRIRFGISADGSLTYQETVYPDDGTMASERAMSERMLREAGPFDPLTIEMQKDDLFQKMSVVVNLY